MMTLNEAKAYLGEQHVLHPLYSAKKHPWHTSRSADISKTFARERARLKRLEKERLKRLEKEKMGRQRKSGQKHLASPAQVAAVVTKIQRTSRMRRPTQSDVVVTERLEAANA